ncbi:DUF5776 domain-containing protein [Lentilactobacillus sp. Marseille-Q4993]|uniref:DUF5776 domain-containing protein n=1 Tax=Lentilactobacillus sp. Marseille-Q4993 TaxID=3039492 RepID=UPI0024BC2415|nr:DUF5776 domain-containing protein [Lentilactobacillus sp. Marseille-Q4993]
MNYSSLLTSSLLALPVVILGGISNGDVSVHADSLPISKIVQKTDQKNQDKNQILEVRKGNSSDYQPFFYNGVQIRIDKLRDIFGYNMNDITNAFKQAKRDGFTVINSQILWSDVQPDKSLKPSDIAYIKGGSDATKNFDEKAQSLKISNDGNTQSQVLLKYNLANLTSSDFKSGNYDGVKLRIYAKSETNTNLTIYGADKDNWDSNSTWDKTGSLRGDETKITVSPKYDPIKGENYYDFNVKDFVNQQNHGTVTLALGTDKGNSITIGGGQDFGTKNSSATKKPLDEVPTLSLSKKDAFDFSYLDKVISAARQAGIKMELLWFGSDTTKVSTEKRLPTYAAQNYQWEVDSNGNPIHFKRSSPTSGMGQYNFVLDKNDQNLQTDEGAALGKTFNHIATDNAEHNYSNTIIGSQQPNEPATDNSQSEASKKAKENYHGKADFTVWTLWNYTNNLDSHIKKSQYSVWTRVNNASGDKGSQIVALNEEARKNGGTYLDTVGLDPYTHNYEGIYKFGHAGNYAQGNNMPMVMEDGLGIEGSWAHNNYKPIDAGARIITSLAGGATHNYYDFRSGDGFDLYDSENADGTWKPHEVNGESAISYVRATNSFVNKLGYDLATKQADGAGGKNLLFFNAVPSSNNNFTDTKKFGDNVSVTYKTDTLKSMGIAEKQDDNNILLGSTLDSDATFTIKGFGKATKVENGQYKDAQSNEWVANNDKVEYTNNHDGTITITVPKNSVVRVSNKVEKPDTPSTNGSSSTSSTVSISSTPNNSSSESNSSSSSTVTPQPAKPTSKSIHKAVYAVKGIKLYNNPVFKASNAVKSYPLAKRTNRQMFLATKVTTNKNGVKRYFVSVINAKGKVTSQKGYITYNKNYVKPGYYSTIPTNKKVKVISKSGINSYQTKGLTDKQKHYKRNSVLRVKKVILNRSINRFQLTNDKYITANKKLVIFD